MELSFTTPEIPTWTAALALAALSYLPGTLLSRKIAKTEPEDSSLPVALWLFSPLSVPIAVFYRAATTLLRAADRIARGPKKEVREKVVFDGEVLFTGCSKTAIIDAADKVLHQDPVRLAVNGESLKLKVPTDAKVGDTITVARENGVLTAETTPEQVFAGRIAAVTDTELVVSNPAETKRIVLYRPLSDAKLIDSVVRIVKKNVLTHTVQILRDGKYQNLCDYMKIVAFEGTVLFTALNGKQLRAVLQNECHKKSFTLKNHNRIKIGEKARIITYNDGRQTVTTTADLYLAVSNVSDFQTEIFRGKVLTNDGTTLTLQTDKEILTCAAANEPPGKEIEIYFQNKL